MRDARDGGNWSRRSVLAASATGLLSMTDRALAAAFQRTRSRVIIDNDFHGDPDGLVHLAHQLLSPGSEVRAIVGSHMPVRAGSTPSGETQRAVARVRELLDVMGLAGRYPVFAGSDLPVPRQGRAQPSAASQAIIAEAMRTDSPLPLYYAAGAGLTELATAWRLEPRIGPRLTLVWIGGDEYPDLAPPPPGPASAEFNVSIDVAAARIIFGESDIPIWQVPRSTYRKLLFSHAELDRRVRPCGRLGAHLVTKLEEIMAIGTRFQPEGLGETVVLGDSALVTLTALQSSFSPEPSSSPYVVRPAPQFNEDGRYRLGGRGRPIRVYTGIDARLTFEDMIAKFEAAAS